MVMSFEDFCDYELFNNESELARYKKHYLGFQYHQLKPTAAKHYLDNMQQIIHYILCHDNVYEIKVEMGTADDEYYLMEFQVSQMRRKITRHRKNDDCKTNKDVCYCVDMNQLQPDELTQEDLYGLLIMFFTSYTFAGMDNIYRYISDLTNMVISQNQFAEFINHFYQECKDNNSN